MLQTKITSDSHQTTIQTTICNKCGLNKPLIEFHKNQRKSNGLQSYCKSCNTEIARAYRETHREKLNLQTILWKKSNRERINQLSRKKYHENPEKFRLLTRSWKKKNPDAYRAQKANRRAREANAIGSYNRQTISELYIKQQGKCSCCGKSIEKQFQVDHIIPLSRGGSNLPENLQLLTPFCNRSKRAKTMTEYMNLKSGGLN